MGKLEKLSSYFVCLFYIAQAILALLTGTSLELTVLLSALE